MLVLKCERQRGSLSIFKKNNKNNDVMSLQTMLVYEKRVLLSLSSNQFEFKVLLPRDPLSKQTSGQNPFVKIVAIFILEVLFHP